MALFGDLKHHALTDLAKVLKAQTGTLFFHEAYQGRTLELALRQGHLHAMYLDGFPVREVAQLRDILRHLHAQGRGAYEFQRRDLTARVPSFYDLSLVDVLQEFAGVSIAPDQLPHPDTRFVPTPGAPHVPPSLVETWTVLRPHLAPGASASALARQVGRSEGDVLAMLHRLRAVDLIAPQRAAPVQLQVTSAQPPVVTASTVDGPAPITPPAAVSSAPLVQRLLGALRRLTTARI